MADGLILLTWYFILILLLEMVANENAEVL